MKVGRGLRTGKKNIQEENHRQSTGEKQERPGDRVHEREEAEAERKKIQKKQSAQTETERKEGDTKR